MLREHRRFFLWTALAGLVLRLFFFVYFPSVTDDSRIYLDLASNWLQHGVYGQTQLGLVVATDTRLPGYPAFLAAVFMIFGPGNVRAIFLAQILVDLVTCLLVADLARRAIPGRSAGREAFLLAALCPFLANYSAAVLTETLEVFFTALALDLSLAALDRMRDGTSAARLWTAAGAAISACILLRPDGGILLAALLLSLLSCLAFRTRPSVPRPSVPAIVWSALLVMAVAIAPLVPWTIRNSRALHHFQPLAPRYATESDELAPRGFNRWVRTWIADYASVEEVYWNVPGDKIDPDKLPARALDPPTRDATLALIADYNQSADLTPALDARFEALAAQRIRAHPVRYYGTLPLLRVADVWLRPRTELLPPDVRWWEFDDDAWASAVAVVLGILSLVYVAAACIAFVARRREIRHFALLGGFLLLRSLFLATVENPEPRYTLECYPVIMVAAAALLARRTTQHSVLS